MSTITIPDISAPDSDFQQSLQEKINNKTKPFGALGQLETIASQIAVVQNTLSPVLTNPHMLVFAGDHGITLEEPVSLFPSAVTQQMVLNFLSGGAAINVFCRQHGINLLVIDAGVDADLGQVSSHLKHLKIRKGTRNYAAEKAMTREEVQQSFDQGAIMVQEIADQGCNIVGFGEMGIGNTSSAALIMHAITNTPLDQCIGRGTGLDDERLEKKKEVLNKVIKLHGKPTDPVDVLCCFGGYEIAQQCGAMLKAASLGMTILIDGFITTSALLLAAEISPQVKDYCIATHQSEEYGHQKMLQHLRLTPVLSLGLRLGEGTGCALAYPLIVSAIKFLNDMASFQDANVSQRLD